MKQYLLILLIPLAIYAIQTRKLRNAVIVLGAFSLVSSLVYLFYRAPDVALAEAVIGTTISTILYLVAMQKYRSFTVYFLIEEDGVSDDAYFSHSKRPLVHALEKYCSKQELELHILYSIEPLDKVIKKHPFTLVIKENVESNEIWAHPEYLKLEDLKSFLVKESVSCHFNLAKEVEYEA